MAAGTKAVQRVFTVVEEMSERPLEGRSASAIAAGAHLTPRQTHRALQDLASVGWVEQLDTGAWRLSARLTRIAARLQMALADVHHQYLRDP